MVAVYVGSLVIVVGTDLLAVGWPMGLGGAGKWVGGLVLLSLVGILASPIGLGLRFVLDRLGQRNLVTALLAGAMVGFASIILQPTYPDVSMSTMPVGLLIVHGLAGCSGGLAWFATEWSQTPRPRDAA